MLKFIELSLENKHLILEHVNEFDSYSDYNFSSLFHWNVQGSIKFAFVGKALVLKMTDYISGIEFLSILGKENIDEAILECIDTARELNIEPTLRLVPEITINNIGSRIGIKIEEDPDSHDYILDINDLAEMRASVFRGKRNLLNRFVGEYGNIASSGPIDLNDENIKTAILELTDSWRQNSKQNTQDTLNEFIAIERSIKHSHHLNVRGFGVFVEGNLVAFSIIEDLPDYGVMLHFDKADINYTGIYEYLKNRLAVHLQKEGKRWINFQQDLGIEGLRTMKESYKPVKKLKKHTISFD